MRQCASRRYIFIVFHFFLFLSHLAFHRNLNLMEKRNLNLMKKRNPLNLMKKRNLNLMKERNLNLMKKRNPLNLMKKRNLNLMKKRNLNLMKKRNLNLMKKRNLNLMESMSLKPQHQKKGRILGDSIVNPQSLVLKTTWTQYLMKMIQVIEKLGQANPLSLSHPLQTRALSVHLTKKLLSQ